MCGAHDPLRTMRGRRVTRCICGNRLGDRPRGFTVRQSPGSCEHPGPGKRTASQTDLPFWVTKKQYEDRKRLGLPIVTPLERRTKTV